MALNKYTSKEYQAQPYILLLLVNKKPAGDVERYIRNVVADLPSARLPEQVCLQVADQFDNASYIVSAAYMTAAKQGFMPDMDRLHYNSYSTVDGLHGTIIFIYR